MQESSKQRRSKMASTTSTTSSSGKRVGEYRWWEGLSPEVLALIFTGMEADEMVRTVPFVCRGWREAVAGPYCWAEVDLESWCRRVNRSDCVDFAVRRLVRRAKGTLRTLRAYKLGNSGFSFACTQAGRFLTVLQIPMSEVTDQMVEKNVSSLSMLTVLDISNCLRITSKGIMMFGSHCKSLVQLRRNMPPPVFEGSVVDGVATKFDDGEAMAVANTMPRLEHLEFAYARFSDLGLDAVLTKCGALHVLDIRGCWFVNFKGNILEKCDRIESFKDPWYDDDLFMTDEDEGNNNDANANANGADPVIVDLVSSEDSAVD